MECLGLDYLVPDERRDPKLYPRIFTVPRVNLILDVKILILIIISWCLELNVDKIILVISVKSAESQLCLGHHISLKINL